MICSLNEIEALCRKAARGGGQGWGHAEEAGKAARWLCREGLPGARLLADLLCLHDGKAYSDLAPRRIDDAWSARCGALCPIIAGSLICDRADDLKKGDGLSLGEVAVPLLLAPFASEAARSAGVTVALEWPGARLKLDGDALHIEGDEASLLAARAGSARIVQHRGGLVRLVATASGRHLAPETLEVLERFALRTYAPATEASRSGAGAGREAD